MKTIYTAAAAAAAMALTLATTALANPQSRDAHGRFTRTLSASDRSFLQEAALGGMAEVKLGKLAAARGSADGVRNFGRTMARDHARANDELKALAERKGVALPARLDRKNMAVYNRLARLHGAAFDNAYNKEMRDDHRKDVRAFERESRRASDPDVRRWAAKTLPTLRHHMLMAMDMSGARMGRMHRSGGKMNHHP